MRKNELPWWAVLIVLAVLFAGYVLVGWVFSLLWNWVAVQVFQAPEISMWQGAGILLLLAIIGRVLFGHKHK